MPIMETATNIDNNSGTNGAESGVGSSSDIVELITGISGKAAVSENITMGMGARSSQSLRSKKDCEECDHIRCVGSHSKAEAVSNRGTCNN